MRTARVTAMLAVLLAVCWHPPASADSGRSKAECAAVKAKIRTLQSKMRSGYTAAQGERWAHKLRELRRQRARVCR